MGKQREWTLCWTSSQKYQHASANSKQTMFAASLWGWSKFPFAKDKPEEGDIGKSNWNQWLSKEIKQKPQSLTAPRWCVKIQDVGSRLLAQETFAPVLAQGYEVSCVSVCVRLLRVIFFYAFSLFLHWFVCFKRHKNSNHLILNMHSVHVQHSK